MRGGKSILVPVLLVLLTASALAASTVTVTPIDNEISPNQQASFSLTITNHADEEQRYSIFSLQSGFGWNVDPSPLKDKIIELVPGETYTTTIVVQPLDTFTPSIYNLFLNVESDLGEVYSKPLKIYLGQEGPGDYLPSLKVQIDIDDKITPKEPQSIKIFLENRNPLNLTDLTVSIQSDIPEFNQEATVNVPPLGEKTLEFTVIPNEFQQPKEYTLFFVFTKDEQTVKVVDKQVEILTLLPEFVVDVTLDQIFLKTYSSISVYNDGNVLNTQEVVIPISFWKALFTTSDGVVQQVDGQRSLVWEVTLGPDESTVLEAVTNFRWLLYAAIIILLFAGFYWYVRAPVAVSKRAVITSGAEEALSGIKVTLEVKNTSKKTLKHVVITDNVPGIANVEQGLELGTLKPTKVKHGKKSSKVVWSLAQLEVGEHRIITYKIKAKLNIVGTFSLPRATVTYQKRGKGPGKAYSNIFRLGS